SVFKNKRFLIGLGSGLIAGAILLQLMNVAASGTGTISLPEDSGNEVMTVEELTAMAEHLGYKVYEIDEKLYTQMEVDELLRSANEPQESGKEEKDGTDSPAEDQPADAT